MKIKTTHFINGKLAIPPKYKSYLDLRKTEEAIKYIKDHFERDIAKALNLMRVSAPLIVLNKTNINDYLSGTELPIGFNIKSTGERAEIVQSLAKWKRVALANYGFKIGEGLYTDMNAIRPDDVLDNLHSLYVDQWDWEKVISKKDRNLDYLKDVITRIYKVIRSIEHKVCKKYPRLSEPFLPQKIYFIHSEELEEKYPHLSPKEREDAISKEKGAVFIIGIGAELNSGQPHDGRAADYDDWITETVQGRRGLNGDILVWYPLLDRSFELSSMGIRVDKKSLLEQLKIRNETQKSELYFHRRLLNDNLPLTIGGGIGQSRLCMLFLRKAHVGEVQSSIWPDDMKLECESHNIFLL